MKIKIKYIAAMSAALSVLGIGMISASAEEAVNSEMIQDIISIEASENNLDSEAEILHEQKNPSWKTDENGKKYYFDETGNYLTGHQIIDGKEYYFAANGVMKNGWYTIDNVRMYFSPETGERIIGWINYNGNKFYADESGKYEGLKTVNDKDYIFDSYGILQNGWVEYQDSKYYIDENGIYKGQCNIDGVDYLFSSKGRFKSGWQTVNGLRIFYDYETAMPIYGWINYNGFIYYSDENKGKITGDSVIEDIIYRFDEKGYLKLGFQKFNDGTRYYDNTGKMLSGFNKIDSDIYYFNSSGIMLTDWQTIENKKYYFDENGKMLTGFNTIKGKKYYFNNNGIMQIGWQNIKNNKYYFDNNGIMQTGWQTIKNNKYYFDTNGIMKIGWQNINDKKYYFNNSGVMQTGWQTIEGKKYFFNKDGDMCPKIYKVFVGAGHGGVDSGAVKYIVEKEYTLKVARIVADILYSHGVEYMLSRTADIDTTMEGKLQLCNNYNPDLVIDVHFNAVNGHGFEAYYAQIGGVSKALAENINNEVSKIMYSNGIKTWVLSNGKDRFTLHREGIAPAVLCEGGYVDNIDDAEFIKNNYKKLAEAYAKGVLKTLGIKYDP